MKQSVASGLDFCWMAGLEPSSDKPALAPLPQFHHAFAPLAHFTTDKRVMPNRAAIFVVAFVVTRLWIGDVIVAAPLKDISRAI